MYVNNQDKSREFWVLVDAAVYRRTGKHGERELARLLGVGGDDVLVQRWARMRYKGVVPPVSWIRRIAKALDLDLLTLLDAIEDEAESELSARYVSSPRPISCFLAGVSRERVA